MLDTEKVSIRLQMGDLCGVHALLDAAMPGDTADERHLVAFWRTAAFQKEQRYEEALEHLTVSRSAYGCKTLAHHDMARIFDHLGRDREAIETLNDAPFDQEAENFPLLVNEAKFHLIYLKARNGITFPASSLEEIPSDYVAVLPTRQHLFGQHISRSDVMAIASKRSDP